MHKHSLKKYLRIMIFSFLALVFANKTVALTAINNNDIVADISILVFCPKEITEEDKTHPETCWKYYDQDNYTTLYEVKTMNHGESFSTDHLSNACGTGYVCLLAGKWNTTQQWATTNPLKNDNQCIVSFDVIKNGYLKSRVTASSACGLCTNKNGCQ